MRRVWIGLLAALLLLGIADTLAWYWATDRLASGFAAWTRAERNAGWTVHADPARRSGWPLSASLVVPHLRLTLAKPGAIGSWPTGQSPAGAWPAGAWPAGAWLVDPWPVTWRVERLVLRLRPRLPLRLSASAVGRQTLGFPAGPTIAFIASRFTLHLPWRPDPGTRTVDLAVRGLRIGGPAALALGALRLRLDWQDPDTAQHPDTAQLPGLRFALVAHGIVLPPGRTWPLGRRITSAAAYGALRGQAPATGSPRQRAEAWRRSGGQLVLREAALRWGPLAASLAATIGLDATLQPEGKGRAMLNGYAQALDTLAANGAVTNNTAVAAKAVLSLLAVSPHQAGSDTVTVPVTLRRGIVSVEGLPLLRLPPLQLPSAAPAR